MMKKHSHLLLVGWIAWFVSTSPAWQARGDDNIDFEPALTCDNQNVYANQNFVYLLGGTPGETSTGIMDGILPVPVNMPVGPACEMVEEEEEVEEGSSGRGFWFPVRPESRGQIDVTFCTHSTAVLIPIVYTALVGNTTTCEDLYCVAEGMSRHPSTTEAIRTEGSICPDATSYGSVSFSATKDQLYFVYVKVTMATELSDLQATTMVTDFVVPNDVCSNSIALVAQTQTITTDDFANVYTDVVPPNCADINCTGTSEAAAAAAAISRLWTNQWKGVWYTLPPMEGQFWISANYTSLAIDTCSANNENLYISFYRGTDCQHLVHSLTLSFQDPLPCQTNPVIYNDPSKNLYMFVHAVNDPAIEGHMTFLLTPNEGNSRVITCNPGLSPRGITVLVLLPVFVLAIFCLKCFLTKDESESDNKK
ncbi:hypothetical protein FisN_11Lh299 [Fistulifera solaris]|uniref:Uncharacterized protein n=1 Tax=Fistulifera solaris TaxID=1519565 RepID=A0A1Z5K112_FISSO|nr:hypothetical protein FisN_11Lh299 [Fistulifera solaris]|eukprot:GAX19832.1 hypothetical protein FisN_11Lh299 [Fistulifera solaris]